jgi:hypothetical protein
MPSVTKTSLYTLPHFNTSSNADLSAGANTKEIDVSAEGMRNVTVLGVISFFTDFSTEMVLGVLLLSQFF